MIPIRILIVEDALPILHRLRDGLEATGDFEVFTASSAPAGLLGLARLQPDVLILQPQTGRGSLEEWRRAIERYRAGRSLAVLVMSARIPSRAREILDGMADLGVVDRFPHPRLIHRLVTTWAGHEPAASRAG